jgi:hypothetical protein
MYQWGLDLRLLDGPELISIVSSLEISRSWARNNRHCTGERALRPWGSAQPVESSSRQE